MKTKSKFYFVSTLICASTFALSAPKINLEIRSEFVKETSNDKSVINEENKEDEDMRFQVYYARLDLKGALNDELSYRIKFRLNKEFKSKNDGLPDAVDYAYIDHKISDIFKLRIGKQYINQGGWEGTYSSKDLFGIKKSNSQSYQEFNSARYLTGVGFLFRHGVHKLNIQVANNSFEEDNSSSFLMGLQFIGSFMNGSIKPILTYAQDARTAQDPRGTDGKDFKASSITSMGLGLQYNHQELKAELDYLIMDDAQKDRAIGAADDNEKFKSVILRFSYVIRKWTPIFKYVIDTQEIAGKDHSKNKSYGLSVLYRPWEKSSFDYFISTSSVTVDYNNKSIDDVIYGDIKIGFLAKF